MELVGQVGRMVPEVFPVKVAAEVGLAMAAEPPGGVASQMKAEATGTSEEA